MNDIFSTLSKGLREEVPIAVATVVEVADTPEGSHLEVPPLGTALLVAFDATTLGSMGYEDLDRVITRDVQAALASGRSVTRHYGSGGETHLADLTVFIHVFAPPPRMVVIGAVDFSHALVKIAKVLGYRVTVCDARPVFATHQRFPEADEIVTEWPDEYLSRIGKQLGSRDAICILTHDHKFDVPAIVAASATAVGYIGAMGSRKTHEERIVRLRDAGVSEERIHNVMAPIGINIGARTPEETAVSICAEIIALHSHVSVSSLRDDPRPIHPSTT